MMFNRNHKHSWFDNLVLFVLLIAVLPALGTKNAIQHRHSWLPRSLWAWILILVLFTAAVAGYQRFKQPAAARPVQQEQSI